ncbi:MAG: 30S ribosomal protein S18 [Solirubrobacterales bacterium]|jgi:small subunit ribosomal protein S18|nr:30S ribosomal protein S18 [Solirubrobacterales bacterium]
MARPRTSSKRKPVRPVGKRKRRQLKTEDEARLIYRDPEFLLQFLSPRGKIRARRQTGLSRRQQARLAREVKVARELAILPYVGEDRRGDGEERPRRRRDDDR